MITRRYMIATVIAGLALAGCGSSSKASTPKNTVTTTSGAPKVRPHVTITAQDFSFALPTRIPSGYVDITVVNKGKEDHQVQLVKLGSMTFDQFKSSAITGGLSGSPGTIFVGGPNLAGPGASTTATVKLDPGTYGVECAIPANSDGKPHAAHGMIGTVEVVKTGASDDVAPVAASTITLGDFSFTLTAGFSGQGLVDVSNQGTQIHELVLFKLAAGKTLADAKKFILVPPGSAPPAGPPPVSEVGGATGLTSQQHDWLTMNLTPGNYLLICFFPDPGKGGLPHALEGMIKEFTIS